MNKSNQTQNPIVKLLDSLEDSFSFPTRLTVLGREGDFPRNFGLPTFPAMLKDFAMDVHETDKEVVVSAELPGFKKDDIQVTLHNNVLNIVAESKSETETEERNYKMRERSYGKQQRSINLGDEMSLSESNVKAKYEDGVLNISIPKTKPTRVGKKIAIE